MPEVWARSLAHIQYMKFGGVAGSPCLIFWGLPSPSPHMNGGVIHAVRPGYNRSAGRPKAGRRPAGEKSVRRSAGRPKAGREKGETRNSKFIPGSKILERGIIMIYYSIS